MIADPQEEEASSELSSKPKEAKISWSKMK